MLRRIQSLRQHEEGQALVLAAICMLILAICVLATVNLSFAATQKIRLQNAADAAAYSTAAYQARAMNFMAYTNRAMVVHYSSQMNLHALLTYAAFCTMVFGVLSMIPYVGFIFNVLYQIVRVLTMIIDVITIIATPLIDGLSYGLALAQSAVSAAMTVNALAGGSARVKAYNPAYEVEPFGEVISGIDAAMSWNSAVNASPVPPSLGMGGPGSTLNRAFMTEVANASRHEWTAYGGKNCRLGALLIPRHCFMRLAVFELGKRGRTEWGAYNAGGGIFGILNVSDQIFSVDTFGFSFSVLGFRLSWEVNTWATSDRHFGSRGLDSRVTDNCPSSCGRLNFACRARRALCRGLLGVIKAPLEAAIRVVLQRPVGFVGNENFGASFHFGQLPHAYYTPTQGGGVLLNPQNHFNQPTTLVRVLMPQAELERMGSPFMGRFGAHLGTVSNSPAPGRMPPRGGWRSDVDFSSMGKEVSPFSDRAGFSAMSAAMAYYHRPGDWREPPNLFNPFWGAKLIPLMEYPRFAQAFRVFNSGTTPLFVH